jgi:hypothetical protein
MARDIVNLTARSGLIVSGNGNSRAVSVWDGSQSTHTGNMTNLEFRMAQGQSIDSSIVNRNPSMPSSVAESGRAGVLMSERRKSSRVRLSIT